MAILFQQQTDYKKTR